jgi:NAD(P)-dependent dehydrogenase (short-subunit alcohol dehydrogenase family)
MAIIEGLMKTKNQLTPPPAGCAWVTGASAGLGRSIALNLAKQGWRVVATARSHEKLITLQKDSAALPGTIVPLTGDITDRSAMAGLVEVIEEDHGPIELAILNAGIYRPVYLDDFDQSEFDSVIDVNIYGTVNCLAPLLPKMKTRQRGHIAIVSSVTGYGGLPTCAAYGASKAALINLAECMEIELKPFGITTSIVNPGFINTPAQDDLDFAKPFMLTSDQAAERVLHGLSRRTFEITFPKRFTYMLKALSNLVPKQASLSLIRSVTGWSKRNPKLHH